MHADHDAILIDNGEHAAGMAGLIEEGCANKAPQSIISIAETTT